MNQVKFERSVSIPKFFKRFGTDLGALAYCFSQRFNLHALLDKLLGHASTSAPTRELQIRAMTEGDD